MEETVTQEPTESEPIKSYILQGADAERVANCFDYHAPNAEQAKRYTYLRAQFRALAYEILERTPKSREQSLALTHLEDAMMWSNAAIVRNE